MILLVVVVVAAVAAGCSGGGGSLDEDDGVPSEPPEPKVNGTVGAVAGTVLDEEQQPIIKAEVGLDLPSGVRATNTSESGRFAFEDVPPGEYRLFAQQIGYAGAAQKVTVVAGEVTDVEVRLRAAATLPSFPVDVSMSGLRTQGGWFQIPYAEATAALPDGFDAKPHVLLEPTGVTAEYHIYTASYEDALLQGESLGPGAWSFEVLSVVPPEEHGGVAHTVEFFVFGSHATDARLAALLTTWNVPTAVADVDLDLGAVAADTFNSRSTVTSDDMAYVLTTIGSQDEGGSLTGGALSVRIFGTVDDAVANYVIINIADAAYSITGAANIDGDGLAFSPTVPDGEAYVQWGTDTTQFLQFEAIG